MASGLLTVNGTIDLDQFWPVGSSDADTTKVLVAVSAGSFRFQPFPGAPAEVTSVFADAVVVGRARRKVIDNSGRITVRLQGVDAPELHYRPPAHLRRSDRTPEQHELYLEWNHEYRQHFAEAATIDLRDRLAAVGEDPVPCLVVTAVDEPSEVFDTYGRFVGDIVIATDGNETNINRWLMRQGWAFPGFYSSMLNREIENLLADANAAWADNFGIWPHLPDTIGSFDFDLRYRGRGVDAQPDEGPVIYPKFFRRLAQWAVNRKAKMLTGTFHAYLRSKPEYYFHVTEFLEQGPTASTPRRLDEAVSPDGFVELWPEEFVFQEAPSRLVGPGNVEITDW